MVASPVLPASWQGDGSIVVLIGLTGLFQLQADMVSESRYESSKNQVPQRKINQIRAQYRRYSLMAYLVGVGADLDKPR